MFHISVEITFDYLFFTYESCLNFCRCFLNKSKINDEKIEWIVNKRRSY